MDLSCLTIKPPIPPVPKLSNDSKPFDDPAYNPSSGGLAQMISSAILQSTFSTNDIHSLVNNVLNRSVDSWTVSEITKTKPIPSIIIFACIAVALFLIFSITFCVVSCGSSKKNRKPGKGTSKTTQVCACLLVLVYLAGIGDVIYVSYRINQSKSSIDDTIKGINRDIYPRDIGEHVDYLNKQFNRLDQYCVNPKSILINASKSMLVEAFDRILNDKYLVQNIVRSINTLDGDIRALSDEVDRQSSILPQTAIDLFNDIDQRYRLMLNSTQTPIKEVCKYANGSQTDIDQILLDALDIVHQELKKVDQTVKNDILSKITPWQDHLLLDTKSEEQIRGYISLAGTIIMVLVIVLGAIPVIFFVLILISRLCNCCGDKSRDELRYPMAIADNGVFEEGDPEDHAHIPRNKVSPGMVRRRGKPSRKGDSSGVVLCLMRLAFFVMIILLIVLALVTTVYYVLDIVFQSGCRTAHNDQPYLINLVTEKLIGANVIFGNSSAMNLTITNIINDCGDQIHFSRKLLENYWSILDTNVKYMMNTLSEQIFDQFVKSIRDIDVPQDLNLLVDFLSQANVSNIPALVQSVETDLKVLEGYFDQINRSNATLPQDLVQATADEFKSYVEKVLESTIDACPLPLSTVLKTDTLVCHTLGGSISGLWFDVFVCMLLITVGLCIFGIAVYKGLIRGSSSAVTRRF